MSNYEHAHQYAKLGKCAKWPSNVQSMHETCKHPARGPALSYLAFQKRRYLKSHLGSTLKRPDKLEVQQAEQFPAMVEGAYYVKLQQAGDCYVAFLIEPTGTLLQQE